MVSKKNILLKLRTILDPELGINIVDMGLVYDISVNKGGMVRILMTLTSMGCPLSHVIEEQASQVLLNIPGVKEVRVDFTFDPPWSSDLMSESAKEALGFL